MTCVFSPHQVLLHAFPGILQNEAEELVSKGQVRSYPAETTLCHEMQFEDVFYIILDGMVRVTKRVSGKQERLLKVLATGDFFGAMSLIQNGPRGASVTTSTPTTVMEIDKKGFDSLLRCSASLTLAVAREVSRRLRENDELDIEDLRIKARELAAAYQKLSEQEYVRRELLGDMSFELGAALTTSMQALQEIQSGKTNPAALQLTLEMVQKSLQHGIARINDLLFSQEMDLILAPFVPVDVGWLVTRVVESQQEEVGRARVSFDLSIDPCASLVQADPDSLSRAIIEFVKNAIWLSAAGGEIHIRVDQAGMRVRVEIYYHGIYKPPGELNPFALLAPANGKNSPRLSGSAAHGLLVAQQLIEQHAGTLEIESWHEAGTRILITLPVGAYI